MNQITLSADTGCEMSEAEFRAWVSYVADRVDERCGFEVGVEAGTYDESFADRVSGDNADRERAIREAKESLWEDWCATGWDAWRAEIHVGDRVEAGRRGTEDHDTGEVMSIDGIMALVAWDGSGDKSEILVDGLSKVAS